MPFLTRSCLFCLIMAAISIGQVQVSFAGDGKGVVVQGKPLSYWVSQATRDAIAIITFIGFVFLLGTIVFAAYIRSREDSPNAFLPSNIVVNIQPTLRPTFTPTPDPNNPNPPPASDESAPEAIEVAVIENSNLPFRNSRSSL